MVKVIFLLKFRRDLDPEEVRRWWRSDHGALALRNTRMRRYVQNHWQAPVDSEHAEGGLEFQGCVEVWFDNMEDYEATMASPEWAALEADGPNGFEMLEFQGGLRHRARDALGRGAGRADPHLGRAVPPG